ncbi:MAG: isoprenylcysteine carboxylmethyltransferase family protein [bacterium]
MDTNNSTPNITPNSNEHSGLMVHQILAMSYMVYFVAIFVGYIISLFWDYKFESSLFDTIGLVCIMIGTALSFWAQYVSGQGSKNRNTQKDVLTHTDFLVGPYNYTRSPTQFGLLFMALGLALLYGSMIMIATTIIAFVLGKFIFIPLEEKHLLNKYGQSYQEYKNKVKL